ncbi:MAG TPA: orotate phosphoribosyltransferase [Nitrososphaerales archaeon]|nr:orotate phosphoribosyltransferase [Nitrososphaerales archaeon]
MEKDAGAQESDKMLVGKIHDGIVIDHITPCKSSLIMRLLNPSADTTLVIAKNVPSTRFGTKDLLKIEGEFLTSIQIDMIALISPHATVNLIEGGKVKDKHVVKAPTRLVHMLDCENPKCSSKGQLSSFSVSVQEPIEHSYFDCTACGYRIFYKDGIEQILVKASDGILISKERIQKELLDLLVRKGGLRLGGGFTLKSGRQSPYFVNIGALTDGESLSKMRWVLAGFVWLIQSEGKISDFDFVFGPAYKGINLAALTCEGFKEYTGFNKRYLYDRKETKQYGDMRMDEQIVGAGYYKEGQKVLIVDDTITTGQTKVESIEKLSLLKGHELVGVVVFVDRQEVGDGGKSAVQALEEKLGVKVYPILTARDIFSLVKTSLPPDQRAEWVSYYKKYGTAPLE